MESVVYAVGLAMGSVMLGSVCYVWVRKQQLGMGGGFLGAMGVVLLGLSVWTGVSVEVSKSGIKADFERLQGRLDEVTEASQVVSEQVQNIAQSTEANRSQFVQLTRVLEADTTPTAPVLRQLRERMVAVPQVNHQELERASRTLQVSPGLRQN
ncbi:MAG: hypothetical protein K0U98_02770 [Deltaproteobacteria bacterium]|nr:hypothetical protein [Deltaproteobacteria bacterium]